MTDAHEIRSPHSDLLGELLFKFEWCERFINSNPSLEVVLRVGLRAAIIRHDDFSLHIYPNDHGKPHFHVRSNGETAAFFIENGERVPGHDGLARRDEIVKFIWEKDKLQIAKAWNETRPTDKPQTYFSIPSGW